MLVDFFHSIYSEIKGKNKVLSKIQFYSFLRLLIRSLINILVPIVYSISKSKPLNSLKKKSSSSPRIIISLTTFPARVSRVWIVIETILRQKTKPDKIILWISSEQFESCDILPKKLLTLQEKGLEIRFCEGDLRSHKKYYYAFKEFPNDIIVLIDDDLLYPSNLITNLTRLHKKYPDAIICNRAWKMLKEDKDILPYSEWKFLISEETEPTVDLFYTTGHGTLIPPNLLDEIVLSKEIFMKYCFYADDVWLNMVHQLSQVKVAKLKSNILLPVLNRNDIKLSTRNVYENLNDKQIYDLRKYFIEKENKDPFERFLTNLNSN